MIKPDVFDGKTPYGKTTCFFACIALAFTAAAESGSGLVHWWRAKDLNDDGRLQANELYDAMTVSAATPLTASSITQDTKSEMAVPVSIGTGVTSPSMRKVLSDAVYFSLNNPTNYVDGNLVANWQSVTLPKEASIGCEEGTVIARVKWHGCSSLKAGAGGGYNYNVALYANNYNTTQKLGWRFGLRCYDSSTSTQMYPSFFLGDGTVYTELGSFGAGSQFLVRKDIWCDVAASFSRDAEGNTTVLFVMRNSLWSNNRDRKHYTFTKTDTVTGTFPEPGAYNSYIGYNGMTGFEDPVGRGEDTFGGDIRDIRVYDRAMSEYEILSEFTDSPPLYAVGSVNSSGDEFSDVGPADVYEPDVMEWSRMRKTLNAANPAVSVKCNVEENGRELGRLVELKFVEKDRPARIEVSANGARFGLKHVGNDGWVRFFVPASIMSSLEKDETTGMYPMTLTFRRTDSIDADMTVDFLRVGGAWQLGSADGSYSEFGGTGDNYYNFYYNIGQRDVSKLGYALATTGSYTELDLFFRVGRWAAANLDYRLILKSVGKNSSAVMLKLNGADETYREFAMSEMSDGVSVLFPAGTLSGDDHIQLSCLTQDSTKWTTIDFWRLEPVWNGSNHDGGMTIIVR